MNNKRILLVDDTPENIDILGEVLKGYKKSVALNGEKALKIVRLKKPDLILLDIMMPEMDGFEVCRRLKSDPETADIPVIFITAKNSVEDETRGLELGAVDFIPKPISPPVVLARVKNQLDLLNARQKLMEKNEELTFRNKYITDSINYANRIQKAILPQKEFIDLLFPDNFLIHRPKDIVSGDFYWTNEIEGKKIIAVIDCTGHGVPGAFMSMIGNTLLNDIITYKKETDPGKILDLLDEGIVHELNKDVNTETYDGMDLGICVLDEKEKTLRFSGSYRPLYCFKDNELLVIKGDRKSIGDRRKGIKYTTHVIKFQKHISFYLFTDGYADQNNSKNEKIGTKRLREIIIDINSLPSEQQEKLLLETLQRHSGDEIQRDDITITGIKI